jgi:hypothetical protein
MAEVRSAPAVRGLEDRYEILGELRGSGSARYYIGRVRDGRAAEVAIVVVTKAEGGETSDLAHFAADSNILTADPHPAIPRVLESRWVGNDTVAVVSERVSGESLGEQLERGERFPNPRIARILEDVSAALDWAREAGVVHRGVTPDSLIFERGTNRVRVSFVPTPIPMTGVPDAATDARTIGMLAWAFLTGEPYAPGETRSLAEACPNLAARVVDATDKLLRSKDHKDAPDVERYLSILAAADALKQAEVELLAQKEEYDEAHRRELQKCEVQRQEVEQHAAEQASLLAGEREEFQRQIAEERAALEAERAQFETMMAERKERFAAVRAELDQQRAEMERRVAELENYRAELGKVREEALAAREEAKTAREDAKVAANKAAQAAAAHAAAIRAANEAIAKAANEVAARDAAMRAAAAQSATPLESVPSKTEPLAAAASLAAIPSAEEIEALVDAPVDIPTVEPFVAPKLSKPPKAPKWNKIAPVDLEKTDEAAVAAEYKGGRPRWMIPSAVGTLALILVAAGYRVTHRTETPANTVRIGNSTVVPTGPATQAGILPRGGFLTQSAGGTVTPSFSGNAAGQPASGAVPASPDSTAATDSTVALTQAQLDSVAEARAARARRAAAREAARQEAAREAAREAAAREEAERQRQLQQTTDSLNSPSSWWNRRPDTVVRRDTSRPQAALSRPRADSGRAHVDSVLRRLDSLMRPRPDTLVRR